jgi:pilus assembly protein Flp/PilA
MTTLRNTINQMLGDESGLSSVEYALLLAFIGVGIAAAATGIGNAVITKFTEACNTIAPGTC